jgi:uncharacterized protein (DUF433 family)
VILFAIFEKGFMLMQLIFVMLILSQYTEDTLMYEDRIVIDPAVSHGKPIIKEYDVEREDVPAALAYAARIVA